MNTQETPSLPWYKKKLYIAILSTIGLVAIASVGSSTSTPQTSTQKYIPAQVVSQSVVKQEAVASKANTREKNKRVKSVNVNSGLSNNIYYTNTAGERVHSPAYSNSVPDGASAKCRDGTYSFSRSRSGTCSHHGGVIRWY